MGPVQFSRKPYTITITDEQGVKKTVRRTPPPKLHQAWPQDKVELTSKYSDDFKEGGEYAVKHINPRNPNLIQLEDKEGNSTFVPYFHTELEEMVNTTEREKVDGVSSLNLPINNKYLTWP